jgi:hypothetical protein
MIKTSLILVKVTVFEVSVCRTRVRYIEGTAPQCFLINSGFTSADRDGTGTVFITLQVRPLKLKWNNTEMQLNVRQIKTLMAV